MKVESNENNGTKFEFCIEEKTCELQPTSTYTSIIEHEINLFNQD